MPTPLPPPSSSPPPLSPPPGCARRRRRRRPRRPSRPNSPAAPAAPAALDVPAAVCWLLAELLRAPASAARLRCRRAPSEESVEAAVSKAHDLTVGVSDESSCSCSGRCASSCRHSPSSRSTWPSAPSCSSTSRCCVRERTSSTCCSCTGSTRYIRGLHVGHRALERRFRRVAGRLRHTACRRRAR